MSDHPRAVLLSGGLGGARLAPALAARFGDGLTIVANVGDDLTWRTLPICPDLDSILYSLAGLWDSGRGWGRRAETWEVRSELERQGSEQWFNVGDRDLALHLHRASLLAEGASLGEVAEKLAGDLGVGTRVVPASDELDARTTLDLADGRRLSYQEWFVRERAEPEVHLTRLSAAPGAQAAIDAIEAADLVIVGPSNPVSSIGAILALAGVGEAVRRSRRVVAVSPVVVGAGTDDPGIAHHARARSRLLAALDHEDTPESIAVRYADVADAFVLDRLDSAAAPAVERAGLRPVLASILEPDDLASVLLAECPSAPASR
jgi:LPPG:FO 2-phospho-L-lactate transferase